MKRNIKSVILTVILAFAFALTGCKFSDNNQQKTKKQNTNTPSTNPSGDNSEDPELELDSSELPLTLEAITAGRIILSGKDSFERISIQKGNGLIFDATDNIDVQPGDKIRFYGSKYISDGSVNLSISCTADCYVYGNAMSLLYYTNFKGKTQITQNYVFQKLFLNNTHIKNHETLDIVLPATTLSEGCYKKMFYGCTGLTRAPELPAATLTKECYNSMFLGCKKLNSIKCLATNISASDCTKNWVVNVSSSGAFISAQENSIWRYKDLSSGIPKGWSTEPPYAAVDAKQIPLTLEAIEDGSIVLIRADSFNNLQYSKNNGIKTAIINKIDVSAGDKVCFFAEDHIDDTSTHLKISCTSDCYVYGNIMSLIDPVDFSTKTEIKKDCTFLSLFEADIDNHDTHIKNCAIELVLPATTLSASCYAHMFKFCDGITVAPELPATTLTQSCYYAMFQGCRGLTIPPELSSTVLSKSCYDSMFRVCTGLTIAPELPATTMVESCYSQMFKGCTGLTIAPELPATTLSASCYAYMFEFCDGITVAPELPARTLADSCYEGMFGACTGLTVAPELPATTLANSCYDSMFVGCRGLTVAPELPAETLAQSCYYQMFYGCTGLTVAPELPATTLAQACYYQMFYGCTELTTAPELPAKQLVSSCYRYMFDGCSKLHFVKCDAEEKSEYYIDLLCSTSGNSPLLTGILICAKPDLFDNDKTKSDWPGWLVEKQFPLTLEAIQNGTITITNKNQFTDLKYYKNGGEISDTSITVSKGDRVYFYAQGPCNEDTTYMTINCSSDCYIYGNLMSLVATDYSNTIEFTKTNVFNQLFKDNSRIKNHPAEKILLPATGLTDSCYRAMFSGCTGLTVAPTLPATTLAQACYYQMFSGCTGLTVAPELPATTLAQSCYYQMFFGCTGLTVAPELPATTLANSCYDSMFRDCTGLTVARKLPATTLANSCYDLMFCGCTGLTVAPELPATTLAKSCYMWMFRDCTGLTVAPELPATTLAENCYYLMFSGCTGLTAAPELPATTLAENCYYFMFSDCTGLVSVPCLPAPVLVRGCYEEMFNRCTSLKYVKCLATNISATDCTTWWFNSVPAGGTFVKAKDMNDWQLNSINGIPSGWIVEEAEEAE